MIDVTLTTQVLLNDALKLLSDKETFFHGLRLPDLEQSRVFLLHRNAMAKPWSPSVFASGRFVWIGSPPDKRTLWLGFCEFPEGGQESVSYNMLSYEDWEMDKAAQHLVDWLEQGTLPVADNQTRKIYSLPVFNRSRNPVREGINAAVLPFKRKEPS